MDASVVRLVEDLVLGLCGVRERAAGLRAM